MESGRSNVKISSIKQQTVKKALSFSYFSLHVIIYIYVLKVKMVRKSQSEKLRKFVFLI